MASASMLDARGAPGGGTGRIHAADPGPAQTDLVRRLSSYSVPAAKAYEGALWICRAGPREHMALPLAYALRDVVDHLARVGQDKYERALPLRRSRLKALLMRTFGSPAGQGRGCNMHYQILADARDMLNNLVHMSDPGSRDDVFKMMPGVEEALRALATPRTSANTGVDAMMSRTPTPEGARQLISMMSSRATQYQVIGGLDTGWLGCMEDAGLFKDTKMYEAAHLYLCRCAASDPDGAVRIITSYDPWDIRDNPVMYGDLLDCASGLSADHAERILGFMGENKLHDLFVQYPEKYLRAAASLCDKGRCSRAADLARSVLTPENIRHGLYPGSGWLDLPLRQFVDVFLKRDPLLLFGLLADLLETIIQSRGGKVDDSVSSMSVGLPAVEESELNPPCLESSVVGHMRDCLTSMGDPDGLRAALAVAGRKQMLVYRRLEMFTYNAFPSSFDDEVEDYALRYLGHQHLYHEHYVMLKNNYCSMRPRAKRLILEAIMRPSDGAKSDRKIADLDESRQLRYLECIADCLDDKHYAKYRELVKKHGRDPHPGHLRLPDRAGPLLGPGPLDGKDTREAIDIMRRYVPEQGDRPDSVLVGFSYLAGRSPGEFSRHAMDLADASPSTQYEFFRGMGVALQDGRSIDWGGAIKLVQHVAGVFKRDGSTMNEDTALAACSMLEDAFQHAPPGVELRDDLWAAITGLIEASAPDPDYSLDSFENQIRSTGMPIDAFNTAINNLGGRSFRVMMMYALWFNETGAKGLAPKVRDVLDGYAGGPHTVSRNAVIGAYLPSLYSRDRGRFRALVGSICAKPPAMMAFWDGLVRRTCPRDDIFTDLYDMHVEFLTGEMSKMPNDKETFKYTFDHFLSAYLYGYDKSGTEFEGFLDSIKEDHPEDLLDHYVCQVGEVVRNVQDPAELDVDRLEKLWKHEVLSKRDLTGWFIGSRADRGDTIRLYAEYVAGPGSAHLPHLLLDELGSYADEFPKMVAAILCLIADRSLRPDESKSIMKIVDVLRVYPEVKDDLKKITQLVNLYTLKD